MRQVTEEGNGKEFQLRIGGSLEIVLPENPATGFRWSFQSKADEVVKIAGDRFAPGSRPGERGLRYWVIEGAAAGRGTLILAYRRAWESNQPPAKVFTITIRVARR